MAQIIDRRLNGGNKNAVNRQRFLRRYKAQIRQAAADAVRERSVTDTEGKQKISISRQDISEPTFRHGAGGRRDTVHPGNRDFVVGDQIARPISQGAGANGAGDNEEGEDQFTFELSRDEFLDCFFEDLELPDLVKTQLKEVVEQRSVRAGFRRDGIPANIAITRTMRQALGRRIALRGPYRAKLKLAEAELKELTAKGLDGGPRATELLEQIRQLRARLRAIPYLDNIDLRYHGRIEQPTPATRAVMFCIMDVSGSMDELRKDMAKRFFILLYLFLDRSYERIEVVFIRHHVTAKEVDEHEFFHSRESGGTVVSSALVKMLEIVKARYPVADWNMYVAQVSDGENWGDDSQYCAEILRQHLLPLVQAYAYVEVAPRGDQGLRLAYESLAADFSELTIQSVETAADIFPVFRRLLVRRDGLSA